MAGYTSPGGSLFVVAGARGGVDAGVRHHRASARQRRLPDPRAFRAARAGAGARAQARPQRSDLAAILALGRGFLSGDLGESMLMNRPIAPLLAEAIAPLAHADRRLLRPDRRHRRRARRVAALRHDGPLDHAVSVAHLSRHRRAGVLLGDRRHPGLRGLARLAAGVRL